ncbi:MAG: aldo/keto reductase [Dehalococcoidia bacterium]|nr:aldo/keto reductase [Dehalococcoidia bacterium]
MQYRKFGRLDWEASILGFGVMRLPVIGNDPGNIDEPQATRMIRYALDHGVNYVDTAYPYHAGRSEVITGNILKQGYREKVKVATKLPVWLVEDYDGFDRYLDEQLERLQLEKVDFYLLHGLNNKNWPRMRDLGVIRWAEGAMAAGRFDHLAFSFHDDFDSFKQIVDDYDNWTFAQVQYNYMDEEYQAGRRGVEYAAGKGLAVVVMEPVRGGRLAGAPGPVAEVWDSAAQKRSPAEWALLWVWDQPEVSVVLSGMSTMEQVVENVALAGRARPGMLTPEELAVIDQAREAYKGLAPIPCTTCGYCMPCSSGVEVPRILKMYNDAIMYNNPRPARFGYRGLDEEQRADRCTQCGECVEACPQGIDIPAWLEKAHELLAPEEEAGS